MDFYQDTLYHALALKTPDAVCVNAGSTHFYIRDCAVVASASAINFPVL